MNVTLIFFGVLVLGILFFNFLINKRRKQKIDLSVESDEINLNSSFEKRIIFSSLSILFVLSTITFYSYENYTWDQFKYYTLGFNYDFEDFKKDHYGQYPRSSQFDMLNKFISESEDSVLLSKYYHLRGLFNYRTWQNRKQANIDFSKAINLLKNIGTNNSYKNFNVAKIYFDRSLVKDDMGDDIGANQDVRYAIQLFQNELKKDSLNPILLVNLAVANIKNFNYTYCYSGTYGDILEKLTIALKYTPPNLKMYDVGDYRENRDNKSLQHYIYETMEQGYKSIKFNCSRNNIKSTTQNLCSILRKAGEEGIYDSSPFIKDYCN